MVSHATFYLIGPQAMFFEAKCCSIDGLTQQAALTACLNELFYPDGEPKALTNSTLTLIEETKAKVDEADALFLSGLRSFTHRFQHLSEAVKKGCQHPCLYYFLGECYREGDKGVAKNATRAFDSYDMAIKGGCSWGHRGTYFVYKQGCDETKSETRNAFAYLIDLEMQGNLDAWILHKIGESYGFGEGCRDNSSLALTYCQRAIDTGDTLAWVVLSRLLWLSKVGINFDKEKAVLWILEAETKGLGAKDDRILSEVFDRLTSDYFMFQSSKAQILGQFISLRELASQYYDTLIARRSPLGYYRKGRLNAMNTMGIPIDASKAIAVWEEADRVGLADCEIYSSLQSFYRHVKSLPPDGMKILEYGEKAWQVAMTGEQIWKCMELMAVVYTRGIKPVEINGTKLLECYQRALLLATTDDTKSRIYNGMAIVYMKGIRPVSPDGAKALEYWETALPMTPDERKADVYMSMADVYKNGIHPVPLDGAKTLEYCELALLYPEAKRHSIYWCMSTVYERGIPPIAQDRDKARELWTKRTQL